MASEVMAATVLVVLFGLMICLGVIVLQAMLLPL